MQTDSLFASEAVVNQFLDLSEAEGKLMTPMQLIKLVYIAHGWHLAITGEPLVDEAIEAWQYGPVVPDVYHVFKKFGGQYIQGRAPASVWTSKPAFLPDSVEADRAKAIIQRTWDIYGAMTGPQLMQLTHQPGTPWHKVWCEQNGSQRRHIDIPDELIREHFQEKARSSKVAAQD